LTVHKIPHPKVPQGKAPNQISESDISDLMTIKSKFNIGIYRMVETIANTTTNPMTCHKVAQIFAFDDLFVNETKLAIIQEQPNRFVERIVNQFWHTELHQWNFEDDNHLLTTKQVIAFIDDRS
jgi:hypothetical protein